MMNASVITLLLLCVGLLFAVCLRMTDMESRIVSQIAQPIPVLRRDIEQDIVQRHRKHKAEFKMACAMLILPYEHQGPINGEIQPNRTLQMECEYKGEGNIVDAQTTDPYYDDDADVADQT